MKSQNNNFKFISKFKYLMLIPIVICIAAIVIGAIFGFNKDYDFRKVSSFNVKLGTTVTEAEYNVLEDNLYDIVEEYNFSSYRIERVGEGAKNGLNVQIVNDEGQYDSTIESLKAKVEDSLYNNAKDDIESSVVISTSEITNALPKNVLNLMLMSALSFGLILLFVFIYTFIRYNLVAGISQILTILLSTALLTSLIIVARVPVNYYFIVSYFIMIMSIVFNTTYFNNHIKETLNDDKYLKVNNADRVYDIFRATYKNICLLNLLIFVPLIPVMFFGGTSLLFTSLNILLGLVVSVVTSLYFNTSIWSFWYKRDKDTMLKRRIEAEKKKLEPQTDDKIVV